MVTAAQAALQPPPFGSAQLPGHQPAAPSARVAGSMLPADQHLQTSPAASQKGADARTTSVTLSEEGPPDAAVQRPSVLALEARIP